MENSKIKNLTKKTKQKTKQNKNKQTATQLCATSFRTYVPQLF